jgi:hypothetical protein
VIRGVSDATLPDRVRERSRSEPRVQKKSEAIRRVRKLARKQAQREELITDPRKTKLQAAKASVSPGGTAGRLIHICLGTATCQLPRRRARAAVTFGTTVVVERSP